MKYTALILIITLLLPSAGALASKNLIFRQADSYKERQMISFIKKQAQTTDIKYILSSTDLNNDAIDEYIIKPESTRDCPKLPLCPYYVTAFQKHSPILIGQFDAHKILISDKKAYGIRQMIVYSNPHNDFTSETASWNPHSFFFEVN